MSTFSSELIRFNKFISDSGLCSRREADKLIEECRVSLNGRDAFLGDKVAPGDKVIVDGKLIKWNTSKPVFIILNKPIGITCTTERHVKGNIIDFINHKDRIFPIGRLDKPSEGLIFLTNEGNLVNKILRAGNNHEKEYQVMVDKPINQDFIKRMANGIPILGVVTQKCIVKQISGNGFIIILTQGLNRQIRRMCEYLGYSVIKLKRTRIMNITLQNLPTGKWRNATDEEMSRINALLLMSVKTEEASKIEPFQSYKSSYDD